MTTPMPNDQQQEILQRVVRIGSLSVIAAYEAGIRRPRCQLFRPSESAPRAAISEDNLLANMEAAVEIGYKILSLAEARSDMKRRWNWRRLWWLCVTVGAQTPALQSKFRAKDLDYFSRVAWQVRNLFECLVVSHDPGNTHKIIDHDTAVNGRPFHVIGRGDYEEDELITKATENMVFLSCLLQAVRVT
jgi:hypothetical protein